MRILQGPSSMQSVGTYAGNRPSAKLFSRVSSGVPESIMQAGCESYLLIQSFLPWAGD